MNRLKGAICYVLGPIQYSANYGEDWRSKSVRFMNNLGIGVFNPLDKPCDHALEGRDNQDEMKRLKELVNIALEQGDNEAVKKYYDKIREVMKDITSLDLRFCDKSDFGLMYASPNAYTAGSWMEYGHLMLQRKPVVIFTDGPITQIPLWAWGTTDPKLMFCGLDLALEYIRHIHEDEKVDRLNRWKFFDYDKIFGKNNAKNNL